MATKRFQFDTNRRFPNSSRMVTAAIAVAETVLDDRRFYAQISEHADFDFTTVTPARVGALIKRHRGAAKVALGKIGFRAYASTSGGVFTINVRKLMSWRGDPKRSIPSLVGTLVHEYVHIVDNATEEDFGHGDNYAAGKENSAPYWIGELAVDFANEQESVEHHLRRRNVLAAALASTSVDEGRA
jgi:hypothetical protein